MSASSQPAPWPTTSLTAEAADGLIRRAALSAGYAYKLFCFEKEQNSKAYGKTKVTAYLCGHPAGCGWQLNLVEEPPASSGFMIKDVGTPHSAACRETHSLLEDAGKVPLDSRKALEKLLAASEGQPQPQELIRQLREQRLDFDVNKLTALVKSLRRASKSSASAKTLDDGQPQGGQDNGDQPRPLVAAAARTAAAQGSVTNQGSAQGSAQGNVAIQGSVAEAAGTSNSGSSSSAATGTAKRAPSARVAEAAKRRR